MKKHIKRISFMIVCIILLLVGSFCIYYFSRFRTLSSIQKVTSYEDGYNLYQIDIKYDYDLDQIIDYGITDNQSMIDAIIKEALPLLPVKIKAPDFGCTAFTMTDNQNQVHMGRNYDFKLDTSAMLVYCTPQNGYKSVAFAALDNISANTPDESMKKKLATLTSPFICLDGMNEKGVSIAVLTLDSEPVFQNTGKPTIATTLAIRLVLDRAASTQEAVGSVKRNMICSPPPVEIIISTLQTPQVMDESLNTIATVKPENSLTPDLKLSLISLSCTKTKVAPESEEWNLRTRKRTGYDAVH